jgi:hypothetical protein
MKRFVRKVSLFIFMWSTFGWRKTMNVVQEIQKLIERGRPLVEDALEKMHRDRVRQFVVASQFDIRKNFKLPDTLSSKDFVSNFMAIYDEYAKFGKNEEMREAEVVPSPKE